MLSNDIYIYISMITSKRKRIIHKKKIFIYDQLFMQNNPNLQCFSSEIVQIINRNNLLFHIDVVPPKIICKNLENSLLEKDISQFKTQCSKSPKLRTYNSLFSVFVDQKLSNSYTRLCLPFIVRKRLSQLRLGVLPLRIETDRYQRVKVDASQRYCKQPKQRQQNAQTCATHVWNMTTSCIKHIQNMS